MNAAEATVTTLLHNEIGTLFALPGLHNDPLFDAAYKTNGALRVLHARHEQATAYMALGAAMSTGLPQAFAAVPGPGFLNTTAALLSAEGTCAPVLGIMGQIPQRDIDRNHGHLHEIHDQIGMASHVTKYARRIRSAAEAPRIVTEALTQALSGRPGPSVVECAMDVWAMSDAVSLPAHRAEAHVDPVDLARIEAAVGLIRAARRPMIVVGGGALDAPEQVRALAERLNAPVLSYRRGRGVIPTNHPLAISLPVGHRLWPEVDLVIAIGTRFFIQELQWGTDKDLKVIRIDADAEAPGRNQVPDIAMIGDAAAIVGTLNTVLAAGSVTPVGPGLDLRPHLAWFEQRISRLEPQRGYIEAISAALPPEGIFVDEVTQVGFASRLLMPAYRPRSFISPGYQDNLGWGYGTALGVQAANPDRPVVAIAGDGGFMYQVGELATAAQHQLPLVVVVFDNAMFGNVKRIQQERYDGRILAADLVSPDFVKVADAFGVAGHLAESPAELQATLKSALAERGPSLIQVKCGEMPSAWDMLLMPRNRG
ncbi:MAG: TPP-binding protein [Rhodobacteraceae bacterium]|nr:TPP-binding protein [Paracoccaceae bacterium]